MDVNGLRIPEALCELVEARVWPGYDTPWQEMNRRCFYGDLGAEAAHALSADDDRIVLMKPPFHTIADEVSGGNDFWTRDLTNVGEIEYGKAVIIADFGLGSDSPIILYYQYGLPPAVMYLRWISLGRGVHHHHWVKTHDTFSEFARAVGLTSDVE
jgi:hypothetical protein